MAERTGKTWLQITVDQCSVTLLRKKVFVKGLPTAQIDVTFTGVTY
jgi:hypothetical protein